MNYTAYILSALIALALSTSVGTEQIASNEPGRNYFDANWTLSESKGRAYQPQSKNTDQVLADISAKYFDNNWHLADNDCNSCIELNADLPNYKLILTMENYDD